VVGKDLLTETVPTGSNFLGRKSHSGWVKSPEATSERPLILAQQAMLSKVISRDVARLNLECI
jgi:hypothetical protein